MQDYDLYRSRYLERISVDCLNSIYRLGITDQITKYKAGKHETDALFKLTSEFGLPGERNCGIEDLGIHKELGNGAADFLNLRDGMTEVSERNFNYYSLNNNSLIMSIPLVIMFHNHCTFKEYEQALLEAYIGGYIHPREIGSVYDNALRGDDPKCLMLPNRGVFDLNSFVKAGKVDIAKANQLRAEWEICSIETDLKKKELEEQGFKFIWDYW